jgi:hypothetical protein
LGTVVEDIGEAELTRWLWAKWDPIGWPASDTDRGYKPPEDEYEWYARPVVELLRAGADEHQVARYLEDAEAKRMGLRDPDDQTELARELIAWYVQAIRSASA